MLGWAFQMMQRKNSRGCDPTLRHGIIDFINLNSPADLPND